MDNNNGFFVPIIVYSNAENDKSKIYIDNSGKAGIYQWTHKESGKIYIGSAIDLEKRLSNYFNKKYLENNSMYISRALLLHGYSKFCLSILEHIDTTSLSKEEARKLLLSSEQHYLDFIFSVDEPNTFNILTVAGSRLGTQHSEQTKQKMSEAKSGENHPMFGKKHTPESLTKISEAMTGVNNPMSGKTFSLTPETKQKISASKGTPIFVYDCQGLLVNTFSSARNAKLHFKCSQTTILKYARNGQLFLDKWKLSLSAKE